MSKAYEVLETALGGLNWLQDHSEGSISINIVEHSGFDTVLVNYLMMLS
jgi:hypothetical protein